MKTPKAEYPIIFEKFSGNLSKKLMEDLKYISYKMKLPISTLVTRAVYNEFEAGNPFEKDLSLPKEEPQQTKEFQDITFRLFQFVKKNPGLSLEHLIILRDDIGIPKEYDIKLAYKYLVNEGMFIEAYPRRPKFSYDRSTYRTVKVRALPIKSAKLESIEKIRSPLHDIEED